MKVYQTNEIKNIALLGNDGSGKTTLTEALLFESGIIKRRGRITAKNTVSDYFPVEQEYGYSVFSTVYHVEWNGKKLNIIDCPGSDDFVGAAMTALNVTDTAILLLNGQYGPEVGTQNHFRYTEKLGKPVIFLVNQLDHEKTFSAGDSRSGMVTYYATVGEALGEMYGYKYEGIYTAEDFIEGKDGKLTLREGIVKPKSGTPQPGDIKYAADDVDEEGNPIFTKKNVKIGNGTPDCIGGFNNTFTYKGFDLSVFLKFAIGQDIYNANKQSLTTYSIFENIPQEFSNYYRVVDPSTGKQATLSRMQEMNPDGSARIWGLTKNNKEWGFYPSSYFVEDGSYLRLAQITLGYTLPKTWLKKAMISNARIYFTANNVATLTGYSGYDPEVRAAKDNVVTTPGYDSSAYPRSRSYVVGLNLTF